MVSVREVVRVARDNGWELPRAYEELSAAALGRTGRRGAGLYYTPAKLADEVVELALRHGARRSGTVLDPCCGAGVFLAAAARRGFRVLRGIDLDPVALEVAALGAPGARLHQGDALRTGEPVDVLIGNPPYGHVEGARERAALFDRYPALRGGEIDRYAAFLLRALELLRPGGVAALLVPDTWMTNARAGPLRSAVLREAHLAAVADFGKPFAAAKDTRVQAVVLVRTRRRSATWVGRGLEPLSPAPRAELLAGVKSGWQLYRTEGERALCAAMERDAVPLGAVCEVGYGLRTGRNARHVARRAPGPGEVGLVGGEDIVPFGLRWRPKTLLHAASLRALVERQLGRPRIAIQRIRTNAKAPWARWLEAAMVPSGLVCLDSLSTLAGPPELLFALLGLVSSVAMNRYHRLRTTDVNVKPSSLRLLPVPRRLVEEPSALAAAVREGAPERQIDALVYGAYGLGEEHVRVCEAGFWGDRFASEFEALRRMSDPPARVRGMGGTP